LLSSSTTSDEQSASGSLHGIPIVVGDNIDTADNMMTTAGSLALMGSIAAHDAHIVQRLRVAGAIILAKANLGRVG
jgi:amidase